MAISQLQSVAGRQYQVMGTAGSGGWGDVEFVEDPRTGQELVCKSIRTDNPASRARALSGNQLRAAFGEDLDSHFVRVCAVDSEHAKVLMEKLRDPGFLSKVVRGGMDLPELCSVFREMACGIALLEERGLAHGDLGARNWGRSEDGRPMAFDHDSLVKVSEGEVLQSVSTHLLPADIYYPNVMTEGMDKHGLGVTIINVLFRRIHRQCVEDSRFFDRSNVGGDFVSRLVRSVSSRWRSVDPRLIGGMAELADSITDLDQDNRPSSARLIVEQLDSLMS